jgi:membrane protein YqaA with SNARE-associated domain
MERLLKTLQSIRFKKVVVIIGTILAVGSIFISVNPEPFLATGYLGVFIYATFGPVTIIIPSMSQHYNLYMLSAVAALGVVINDTLAYLVGRNADVFISKNKKVLVLEKWVNKYGYFALFAISVLPIPYDFIGLLVGYLDLSFKKYAIPLFVGKFFRFVLIGLGTNFVVSKF